MLLADGRLSATFLPQQVKVEEGEVDAAWMVMRCRWRRGGGDGGGGRGAQWFHLVPLTRFGPILRKKSSDGGNFFLVRAKAKAKVVLKHKLPNNDYRRCTR